MGKHILIPIRIRQSDLFMLKAIAALQEQELKTFLNEVIFSTIKNVSLLSKEKGNVDWNAFWRTTGATGNGSKSDPFVQLNIQCDDEVARDKIRQAVKDFLVMIGASGKSFSETVNSLLVAAINPLACVLPSDVYSINFTKTTITTQWELVSRGSTQ